MAEQSITLKTVSDRLKYMIIYTLQIGSLYALSKSCIFSFFDSAISFSCKKIYTHKHLKDLLPSHYEII